jgi:meiotic recombination protein SPO11
VETDLSRTAIYALVDGDPHGLDILSVYTRGSKATKFSQDHAGLALGERLQWIGVRASEWLQ